MKRNQADIYGRSALPLAALLFIIAFLPRMAFLYQLQKSPLSGMLMLDAADYDRWALEIARGNWMGGGVFYAMPFYPYFLGIVYSFLGHALSSVRLIQILVGSVNCLLAYRLAKEMFGARTGLVAFFLSAFMGTLIFYDNMITPSCFIIFFYLIVLNLVAAYNRRPTPKKIFLIGAVLGASCLITANGFMFTPFFIFWIFRWPLRAHRKRAVRHTLIFLAALCLTILPVTFRNYAVSGDFIPITAHGGLNFYLGNNPLADGTNSNLPFLSPGSSSMINDSIRLAKKALGRPLKPSEVSDFWFRQGVAFIINNPAKFAGLAFVKLRLFLLGYEIPDIYSYYFYSLHVPILKLFNLLPLGLNFLFPCGIIGVFISLRRPPQDRGIYSACILFFISFTISSLLFLVNTRYKIPVIPVLAIFSSYAIVELFDRLREKKWKPIIAYAVIFFIVYRICNSVTLYSPDYSADYVHFGGYLLEKNEIDSAIEQFKKAVALAPNEAEAHNVLGLGYLRKKDFEGAEAEFKRAIDLKPAIPGYYNNLGRVYMEMGKAQEASDSFKRSLSVDPDQPELRYLEGRGK